MPTVTVLLPVYNGEKYLRETLESILAQTWKDFELLIVDDGSTDRSAEIIASFDDKRIRVLSNPERLKLSGALNRGLREARGEHIARMDADDIAFPQRLQSQIDFMRRRPETGICGTGIEKFGCGKPSRDIYPASTQSIKAYALFDCPFCHPTVMMRRDMLLSCNLWYDGSYYPTEDYELWTRAADFFPVANMKDVLLRYRIHDGSMTGSDWDNMDMQAARIIRSQLEKIGMQCSDEELLFHRNIGRGRSCRCSFADIGKAERWLARLAEANRRHGALDERSLAEMLSLVWYRLCMNNSSLGWAVWTKYVRSSSDRKDSRYLLRMTVLFLSTVKNSLFSSSRTTH